MHLIPCPLILLAVAGFSAGCGGSGLQTVDSDAPLRIVVLSDLNGEYGSTEYGPEVMRAVDLTVRVWQPDLVLIAGDMVAGQQPALPDEHVRVMWAAFDSVVAAPLRAASIPLVFTLGNHDASGFPAHARDRRLATEYWRGAAAAGVAQRVSGQ